MEMKWSAFGKVWVSLLGVVKDVPLFTTDETNAGDTETIALAVAPGGLFRLLRVEAHWTGTAPDDAQDFTITLDAGDDSVFDVVLGKQDPSVGSLNNLVFCFGKGYEFEADDEIDIAYGNTGNDTIGVRAVYELL